MVGSKANAKINKYYQTKQNTAMKSVHIAYSEGYSEIIQAFSHKLSTV